MAYTFQNLKNSIKENMLEVIDSPKLNIFGEVIDEITDTLVKEEDFYRWEIDQTIEKMFRELRLDSFSGTQLEDIFKDRPDLLWSMTRWRDNQEGVKVLFKSFGIFDHENFTQQAPLLQLNNYKAIKDYLQTLSEPNCDLNITLKNTDYTDNKEISLRILVLVLYADIMLSVCRNLIIKAQYNLSEDYNLEAFTITGTVANYNTEILTLP